MFSHDNIMMVSMMTTLEVVKTIKVILMTIMHEDKKNTKASG